METISNQRTFMDELAKKFNVKSREGWYKVNTNTFRKNGGSGLLNLYKGSMKNLLSSIYDEYPSCWSPASLYSLNWDVLQFSKVPNKHWSQLENQRAYLERIAQLLSIKKMQQ